MKKFNNLFAEIISWENLLVAWIEFKKGKMNKADVQKFYYNFGRNLLELWQELTAKTYRHSPYSSFYINDPKQRHIYKAQVRDRILHHAVFEILNSIFEPTFISRSFSCRQGKGTHKAVQALTKILNKVSRNNT